MTDLDRRALGGLARFIVGLGLLLFLPAWSLAWWQAWVFLALFAAATLTITLHLMRHDPALLARRLKAGPGAETQPRQKIIQSLNAVAFVATILVPAIDHRLGWSAVPLPAVIAGDALVVLGLLFIFLVLKANSFAAGNVSIEAGQKVVSTGPYAIVRHPMYLGALVMLLGMPPALGSWWGLVAVLPFALLIAWRLLDEERFLGAQLPGYGDYCRAVRYRLIPFLW